MNFKTHLFLLRGATLIVLTLGGLLAGCQTAPTGQPYAPISSYQMDPAYGISADQVGRSQDPWEVQRWQYQEMQKLMQF